jgi:hypothetical protein
MICEGLPRRSRRHSPANMLQPQTGRSLRLPAGFNHVASRSRPPEFGAVVEWIEHLCRVAACERFEVGCSPPGGQRSARGLRTPPRDELRVSLEGRAMVASYPDVLLNMATARWHRSTGLGRVGSWSRRPSGLKADDVDPTQAAIRTACEWSCVCSEALTWGRE